MRWWLYGSLVGLAGLGVLGMAASEAFDGSCAVICDWELVLLFGVMVAGAGAVTAALLAVAYEFRRALRGRSAGV